MTKTKWKIIDLTDNTETKLTYYHFNKDPMFPAWYMQDNHSYQIEVIYNFKLCKTFSLFFKCLTKYYIIE